MLSFKNHMRLPASSIVLMGCMSVIGLLHFQTPDLRAEEAGATLSNCAPGGTVLTQEVRTASGRNIIVQLSGSGVALRWRDIRFADQAMARRFRGTCEELITEMLKPSSYSIVYEREGPLYRVDRIILVGAATQLADRNPASPVQTSIPIRMKNRQLQAAAKSEQFQKLLKMRMKEKLRAARTATDQ